MIAIKRKKRKIKGKIRPPAASASLALSPRKFLREKRALNLFSMAKFGSSNLRRSSATVALGASMAGYGSDKFVRTGDASPLKGMVRNGSKRCGFAKCVAKFEATVVAKCRRGFFTFTDFTPRPNHKFGNTSL